MDKQEILDNVEKYSDKELVEFVKRGIVTLDELQNETNGQLPYKKRQSIEHELLHGDDDAWDKVKQENTVDAALGYLRSYQKGKHRNDAHALIKDLKEQEERRQEKIEIDAAWQNVNKGDILSLRQFKKDFPDSDYVAECDKLMNDLQVQKVMSDTSLEEEIRGMDVASFATTGAWRGAVIDKVRSCVDGNPRRKEDLVRTLSDDHNIFDISIVRQLVRDNVLTVQDLENAGIGGEYIKILLSHEKVQPVKLPTAPLPTEIKKKSTEVYFWGMPDSGKTCVLGALFSVAASGRVATFSADRDSQGYGYMMQLADLLRAGQVGPLMTSTSYENFYEMGFDLVVGDRVYPLTFIDMAGELMRSMYKYSANPKDPDVKQKMLDTMTSILEGNRSINRKIHFFVIEYGTEDKLYDKTEETFGVSQRTYIQGAFDYIKDTKIFEKDTDAVYILLTKADKIRGANKERQVKSYIDNTYKNVKNLLESTCEDNEINGGKVEVVPFTLGEVCFKDYCRFDPRPAEELLRESLFRAVSYRRGKSRFWNVMNVFRK